MAEREPTEMELRVLRAISEIHSGNQAEGLAIVRAAIRAMREPTDEMAQNIAYWCDGRTEAWRILIDTASPPA